MNNCVCQPDVAQLEKVLEKKKMCLEEEKLKGKCVNYSITPALHHANAFSPASKPGVCVMSVMSYTVCVCVSPDVFYLYSTVCVRGNKHTFSCAQVLPGR